MKTKNVKFLLVLIILFSFPACEDLIDDPCDEFEVSQTITTKFIIRTNFSDPNYDKTYMAKVRAYKVLCDGKTKGEQVFTKQNLGPNYAHDIAIVEYNSNNKMEEIIIEAFAIDNNGLETDVKQKIISHEVMLGYDYNYSYEKYIARFNFNESDFK